MTFPKYWKQVTDGEGNVSYVSDTNLPTPSEVRNRWCYGLPLTNELGVPMTDDDILQFLEGARDRMEKNLGIFLKPTKIVCNPEERGLVKGVDYEKAEPAYDYSVRKWMDYGFLQLRERPVRKLDGLKLVLPNGNIIMDFGTKHQWIKLYPEQGQLKIVPYAGDPTLFAMMGGSASGYPFVTGRLNSNLPQMIYVDYEAGFELGEIPQDVRNTIAKMASIDVLGIAGDAVLAGVASLSTSIDGLSESFSTTASATNATYGAHILQYQKEIDVFFSKGSARSAYRGLTFTGL